MIVNKSNNTIISKGKKNLDQDLLIYIFTSTRNNIREIEPD